MRGPAGYGARNFSGDDQLGLRAPGSWHAQGDHTPLTTAADSLSRGLVPRHSEDDRLRPTRRAEMQVDGITETVHQRVDFGRETSTRSGAALWRAHQPTKTAEFATKAMYRSP